MTGVEGNLKDDKVQIVVFDEEVTVGPYKTLSETEDLNDDPSEGQDWNWEDYE